MMGNCLPSLIIFFFLPPGPPFPFPFFAHVLTSPPFGFSGTRQLSGPSRCSTIITGLPCPEEAVWWPSEQERLAATAHGVKYGRMAW